MENIVENRLILVDEKDREQGCGEKLAVHQQGLLHRAFSVFLWREGQLLLQRRAEGKYHSGGLWANTCCSHPRPGETVLQAAHRRLQEECGLSGLLLEEKFSFIYRAEFVGGLTEYELDHVLLGYYPGPPRYLAPQPDPAEIAELSWWDIADLQQQMQKQPQQYAVWLQLALPTVLGLLKK